MAVLIPNMTLPENCWECPCFRHDIYMDDEGKTHPTGFQCNITLESEVNKDNAKFIKNCPLKEV